MIKSVAFLSLSLAALVGCGGDSKPKISVDAPEPDAPDQAACTAIPMWGSAMPDTAIDLGFSYTVDAMNGANMTENVPGEQNEWSTASLLEDPDMVPMPDAFTFTLAEGPAPDYSVQDYPTPTAQAPLVINLSGPDGSQNTCSTCIQMLTDLTFNAQGQATAFKDLYHGKGGTITFTALSNVRVAGVLENIDFEHIMQNGTPTGDGCASKLTKITFDGPTTMAKLPDGRVGRRINFGALNMKRVPGIN